MSLATAAVAYMVSVKNGEMNALPTHLLPQAGTLDGQDSVLRLELLLFQNTIKTRGGTKDCCPCKMRMLCFVKLA